MSTLHLQRQILQPAPPWSAITPRRCFVPHMISHEEKQYYSWIGGAYSGRGEAIEIGPWLGCSTRFIVDGLRRNPGFSGRRLHVFDDFIWRSAWMDQHYRRTSRLDLVFRESRRPRNHASFRSLFDRYTRPVARYLSVETRRTCPYEGNEAVPPLSWDRGPVELCFVDCGRTIEANEAWYSVLAPHFIPGVTLVIMQDWQLHKELPPKPYNQTRAFTDGKGKALRLIHELAAGTLATFLYMAGVADRPYPDPQAGKASSHGQRSSAPSA